MLRSVFCCTLNLGTVPTFVKIVHSWWGGKLRWQLFHVDLCHVDKGRVVSTENHHMLESYSYMPPSFPPDGQYTIHRSTQHIQVQHGSIVCFYSRVLQSFLLTSPYNCPERIFSWDSSFENVPERMTFWSHQYICWMVVFNQFRLVLKLTLYTCRLTNSIRSFGT